MTDNLERYQSLASGAMVGASLAVGGLGLAASALAGAGVQSLLWGAAAGLTCGLAGAAYQIGLGVLHDLAAYQERRQAAKLASIRTFYTDDNGRAGIVYDGQVYRNLDTSETFTQSVTLALDPIRTQLDAQHKMLQALCCLQLPKTMRIDAAAGAPAVAADAPAVQWPATLGLSQVLQGTPSLDRVILGARPMANGLDIISGALHDLTHILVVGGSGWGKSCFLRALLYQLAQSPEYLEVAAIDTMGSEFNILRTWDKLRYPVARTTQEAAAVLAAVRGEIDRRKGLFEAYPRVTKLTEYNQAAGERLPVLFVMCDEGTNLLAEPGIGDGLRAVVQCARQYGICAILAGQSAHHSVIPTQTRDNFSARICFHTSPTSSQVVLDDRRACDLRDKGRAWVQLPGRDLTEIQTPWVDRSELERVLTTGKPANPMPVIEAGRGDDQVERIKELAAQGKSKRQIQIDVFGFAGGSAFEAVKSVLG